MPEFKFYVEVFLREEGPPDAGQPDKIYGKHLSLPFIPHTGMYLELIGGDMSGLKVKRVEYSSTNTPPFYLELGDCITKIDNELIQDLEKCGWRKN